MFQGSVVRVEHTVKAKDGCLAVPAWCRIVFIQCVRLFRHDAMGTCGTYEQAQDKEVLQRTMRSMARGSEAVRRSAAASVRTFHSLKNNSQGSEVDRDILSSQSLCIHLKELIRIRDRIVEAREAAIDRVDMWEERAKRALRRVSRMSCMCADQQLVRGRREFASVRNKGVAQGDLPVDTLLSDQIAFERNLRGNRSSSILREVQERAECSEGKIGQIHSVEACLRAKTKENAKERRDTVAAMSASAYDKGSSRVHAELELSLASAEAKAPHISRTGESDAAIMHRAYDVTARTLYEVMQTEHGR